MRKEIDKVFEDWILPHMKKQLSTDTQESLLHELLALNTAFQYHIESAERLRKKIASNQNKLFDLRKSKRKK